MPFFSIIIPVYNVAPYLRECLDSLLAQTFADWEAICVDDGSIDGSGAILDEYAARDRRFMVIHQTNAGVSAARNAGIDAARGKYVTFLDGDDAYDRRWLEAFDGLIMNTGAELVRMCVTSWEGDKPAPLPDFDRSSMICFSGDEVAKWGWPAYSLEGWSWLNAIKRTCLEGGERVRFPSGMEIMEDIVFMLRVLPHVKKACQGGFAGYLYRLRATSACRGKRLSKSVVRFFDEVARLHSAASVENRMCVSWMLGWSVLDWRGHRDRTEACGAEIVRGCVSSAMRESMFRIAEIPARWRLGFAALVHLRSFFVMDVLLWLQRAWGRIRRLCAKIAFCRS